MPDEARTVRLPRRGIIALAAFAVLMIALLGMNVLGIARQERLLNRQLGLAERSYDATKPAVQDARRLLDGARDDLPVTKRRARDAARLVDRTEPLVSRLSASDIAGALEATGDLATRLSENDRLVLLVERSERLLAEFDRAGTIDAVRDMRGVLHQVLSIQRRTLSAQLQALDVQRRTLAIQEEALTHIRSLDRKTGGTVPAG